MEVAVNVIDEIREQHRFLPGHEPDETGKAIDNALGALFLRWPSDKLAGSP